MCFVAFLSSLFFSVCVCVFFVVSLFLFLCLQDCFTFTKAAECVCGRSVIRTSRSGLNDGFSPNAVLSPCAAP